MKYYCKDCDTVFDEDDLHYERECVGEFWGSPAYQTFAYCPCCGSDNYEEASTCEHCGETFSDDDMCGGLCYDCLHEYDYDWKFWFEVCHEQNLTESVPINALAARVLTPEEINQALIDFLNKKESLGHQINCKEFINEDPSWASDMILDEE